MLYLESVLCFVLTGRVLELELDTKRAFTIYRETIEYIKSIHSMPQRYRASPHSTFSKLDILRSVGLLYLQCIFRRRQSTICNDRDLEIIETSCVLFAVYNINMYGTLWLVYQKLSTFEIHIQKMAFIHCNLWKMLQYLFQSSPDANFIWIQELGGGGG